MTAEELMTDIFKTVRNHHARTPIDQVQEAKAATLIVAAELEAEKQRTAELESAVRSREEQVRVFQSRECARRRQNKGA